MERDKFMNPTEAKEFGIIDKILEHPLQDPEDATSKTGVSNTSSASVSI